MKTLYESILDDEETLMSKTKETVKDWFAVLKAMMAESSGRNDEHKDIINMLENNEAFQKDIMSMFKDKSNIEIKAIVWGPDERHIGIFHKHQQLLIPDIEFAYCRDKSIYGNTNFVMKFNSYHMLNPYTEKNIKSKQTWSAIPNKLCKKYKLNLKQSPFLIGQLFIY
jgi:hypothetical protein